MNATIAITILSVTACFGEQAVDLPVGPTRGVIFTVDATYGGELKAFGEELSVAKHPDYAGLISEVADGSEKALVAFFEVSKNSPFDAASGEAHICTMQRVLLHWGDLGFSKVLSKQVLDVRESIADTLNSHSESFRLLFPLTYTASTGKDSAVPVGKDANTEESE